MAEERQRIDKWLWFARFARTRPTARKIAVSGQVRVNRRKIDSAATAIRAGDVLTLALAGGVRIVRIVGFAARRGPASEAQTLYQDLTPPQALRDETPRGGPRPTKRDRRALDAFHDFSEDE